MSLAKKSWKRVIALFLAVVMALSFVPNITAFATPASDLTKSQSYNDNSGNVETITLTAADAVYDGKAHAVTKTITGTELTGDYALSVGDVYYSNDDFNTDNTTSAPTEVGNYKARVTVSRDSVNDSLDFGPDYVVVAFQITAAPSAAIQSFAAADVKDTILWIADDADQKVVDAKSLVTKTAAGAAIKPTYSINNVATDGERTNVYVAASLDGDKLTIDAKDLPVGSYFVAISATDANVTASIADLIIEFDVVKQEGTIQPIETLTTVVTVGSVPEAGTDIVKDVPVYVMDGATDLNFAAGDFTEINVVDNSNYTAKLENKNIAADGQPADNRPVLNIKAKQGIIAGTYTVTLHSTKVGYDVPDVTVSFTAVGEDKTPITTSAYTLKLGASVEDASARVAGAANNLTTSMAGNKSNVKIGSYTYQDGKFVMPTVILNDGVLYEDVDFEVLGDYKEMNAGSYTIEVKGINNYTGSLFATWEIAGTTRAADSVQFNLATLGNLNEAKDAIASNFVYDGATTRNVTAKVKESDNPTITYEYYKWADYVKVYKAANGNAEPDGVANGSAVLYDGSDAGSEATATEARALFGANDDARSEYKIPAPVDAGKYVVFAVVKAQGNYAESIASVAYEIDPLPLYIVPDKGQKKTFGDGAEKITFKAYKYYNEGGKHKWVEYIDALNIENETETTFSYDGATVNKNDVRPDVPYTGTIIDTAEQPFLTRAEYETAAGEAVGEYDIQVSAKHDTNYTFIYDVFDTDANTATPTVVDGVLIVNSDLANSKFTIEKRSLSEADFKFYNDEGKEVTELSYPNSTITRRPTYIVRDNITIYDETKHAFKADNKIELENGVDFTVSGKTSADKGGTYTITLTALETSNYKDTKVATWSIAQSKNQAYEGVYKDSDWDTVKNLTNGTTAESALVTKDIFKKGVYETVYDGQPHSVQVRPITLKVDGEPELEAIGAANTTTVNDKYLVYYKNTTPAYNEIVYDGDPALITGLNEVKPSEDWETTVPEFTKAGEYTIDYMIKSQNGLYADITGSFTIKIKAKEVNAKVPSIGAMTFATDASVLASIDAAITKIDSDDDEEPDLLVRMEKKNSTEADVTVKDLRNIELKYTWPEDALSQEGDYTLSVAAREYDEAALTATWIAAHDKAVKIAKYEEIKGDTEDEVAFKGWNDLTDEQKLETKTYDKLTDDEKKAANKNAYVTYVGNLNLAATLALDKARCELGKNFVVNPVNGVLKVMAGSLTFDVVVDQSKQAKTDNIPVWVKTTTEAGYSWKYGTYDTAASLVSLKDANGDDLAAVFAEKATYNVLVSDEGGAFLPGYSSIPASSLDSTLRTLQPGVYRLRANVGVVDKVTSGGSDDSLPFRVAPGELEIVNTEEALIGGSTSAGKAPTGLKAITVKEVSATEGFAAGDNTYKLQFRTKTANAPWVDTLAELKKGVKESTTPGVYVYDPDTKSVWDETALGNNAVAVEVAVVPVVGGAPSDAYFTTINGTENPVTVKIEVTPTEASENDKVANLTITYLAEDAGKEAVAGYTVGNAPKLITKTYGTYTENEKYADGTVKRDDERNYYPVTKDNVIEDMNLVTYVKNELLSNNGFAVGYQNRYGRYENMKFAPYMDAEKFTYDLVSDVWGGTAQNPAERVLNTLSENPEELINGIVYYYGDGESQTSDVGPYRAKNAKLLVENISFEAELISDPDGIIATRKVLGKDEPIFSAAGNDIKYTLAEELPKSGTANIKVTVHRKNFSDIEFYINLVVDGAGPEIGVFNVDLSKDTQTKINDKAKVTDTYVNKALEFTITTNDVKEDGVYYTFTKEAKTVTYLDESYDLAKTDKFDESKGWYKLEGNTITSPAEEGGYILYVRGEDESGNVTYASSATGFTVDSVKPVVTKASDNKEVYGEEAKTYLVEPNGTASIAVVDQSEVTVQVAVGDGEFAPLEANKTTHNYDLTANAETYTLKVTDKAKNETVAKIDVNLAVDNKGNELNVVYAGKDFDLATVTDKTDTTKTLFVKSDNSGDISYANGTDLTEEDGKTYVYPAAGTRGEGKVEDGKLIVTKAGTFVIEVISAKNGIYGKTIVPAYITVEKGTREVGISLVEDKSAATATAKTEFTRTEAANMKDFAKLSFSVEGAEPKDEYVKFVYYNKETGAQLDEAPTTVGEYEVAVRIEDDGLFNATASENATAEGLNKRASYKVVDTHKVVVDNDTTKGTVKVVSGTTEMTAEQLLKTADRTPLTITATALEGYSFAGWTDVKGIELTETEAAKDTVTIAAVTGDVSLKANYIAEIVITKQPADVKAFADDEAKFEVVATGNGDDDLTYQWQVKGKDDADFRNITDATAATYSIAKVATTNDGESYRVVLTSKSTSKTKTSDVAKLEVVGNSLEGATIVLEADSAVYTGKAITPVIKSVTVNDVPVSEARDYDVVATNFVNVGEYTVTIKAKAGSDWTGEASTKFTITAKPVAADMFTIEDVQYTGKAIEAPVVAKDGEIELVADKDFTIAYKDNTEVGTATATITGKGNYTGSVDVTFEIIGKSIKGATVSGLKTVAYTGKAIQPAVTVKLDGKTLKKGTDYDVTYKNNTKVGTATVTITGKGDYSGTITKKFLIKKISFKYRAYVQKKNWMAWSTAKVSGTSASAMAGTTDNLRMETIQMQLSGVSGAIKYRAYVEKMGWTQWATTADTTTYAGTKGMARRVEMIQLQASGQVATLYDMYYRAYSEKFGWLGWAKSGEKAGSAGYARKLEAFQVNFVRKGESFTVKSDRTKCFYDKTKDGANPK